MARNQWALDQKRRKGTYGTTVSTVQGVFGEHYELAIASDMETMIDGMLTMMLDVGSNINTIGLRTALTLERASRSHGRDIKRLNLNRPMCVTGVGAGAAVRWTSGLA
eukprot:4977133-Pyramimonas_sp.AAC.1